MWIDYFTWTPLRNMTKFQLLKRLRTVPRRESVLQLASCRGNNLEPESPSFCFSLDEVFHLPKLKAKLFLVRNWLGGFYRDSFLILVISPHVLHALWWCFYPFCCQNLRHYITVSSSIQILKLAQTISAQDFIAKFQLKVCWGKSHNQAVINLWERPANI